MDTGNECSAHAMTADRNFFYYNLCHYCKNTLHTYQRCASCKSVAYCSQGHQALDWKHHKDLCKAITYSRKNIIWTRGNGFEEWKKYRMSCHLMWSQYLKRNLFPFEYQILMFPKICAMCYYDVDLKDCIKCGNVAYCCDVHMEQHKIIHNEYCHLLKLCMETDRYLGNENSYPLIQTDLLVNTLHNANNMKELIMLLDVSVTEDNILSLIETALKTEAIAPGAVIYTALKCTNLKDCTKMVIHIVGSSSLEATMDWGIVSEIIFHYKPTVQNIIFILIGPDAWLLSENVHMCSECSGTKKTVTFKVFVNLYHEVVGSLETPNLVVAFNCGLHEYHNEDGDIWKNSIPLLIKNNVPFVFTSYTQEELIKDIECLKSVEINLNFLYNGKNCFASLRPMRDWSNKDTPVFYAHGYLGIVIQSNH